MCCTSVAEFAEVCQKEITKFEADIELDTSDGKTVTLLRFVSKLFYKDGTGDPLYASSYILSQGIQKIPIMNCIEDQDSMFYFIMLLELFV